VKIDAWAALQTLRAAAAQNPMRAKVERLALEHVLTGSVVASPPGLEAGPGGSAISEGAATGSYPPTPVAALLHNPDVLILDEPLSGIDVTSAQLFKHLLAELASKGKTILYISHVLEVVERVCAQVIIIYKGRIMAADSVERLRGLMNVPSLEGIFAQLVEERDLESLARNIVRTIQTG